MQQSCNRAKKSCNRAKQSCNRAATELQQSSNRAATEVQQSTKDAEAFLGRVMRRDAARPLNEVARIHIKLLYHTHAACIDDE